MANENPEKKATLEQVKQLAQILCDTLSDYEGNAWNKRSVLGRRDEVKKFIAGL